MQVVAFDEGTDVCHDAARGDDKADAGGLCLTDGCNVFRRYPMVAVEQRAIHIGCN